MVLSRIVRLIGAEHLCPIRREAITAVFVLGDFVAFMTQSTGMVSSPCSDNNFYPASPVQALTDFRMLRRRHDCKSGPLEAERRQVYYPWRSLPSDHILWLFYWPRRSSPFSTQQEPHRQILTTKHSLEETYVRSLLCQPAHYGSINLSSCGVHSG